jgi:hypothetical protein
MISIMDSNKAVHPPGGTENPDRSNIMQKGNLSREQAIDIVGEPAVDAAETTNAVQTGRLTNDGTMEFVARHKCTDGDGDSVTLCVYWYFDEDAVMSADDLSNLDWDDISGYEVG